jgi:hypothetical protein
VPANPVKKATKSTVKIRIATIPIRHLEKKRFFLALLNVSPIDRFAVLSVFILELAKLGVLTVFSCFK